ALEPIFARKAAQAIKFKCDNALFNGTGAGMPEGILNCNAMLTVPLYDGSTGGSAQTANGVPTILHHNINKMYNRIHPAYRAGMVWLAHPNVIENLEYISFIDNTTYPVP